MDESQLNRERLDSLNAFKTFLVKSFKRILPLVNRLTDSPVDSPSSLTVLMSPEDVKMSPNGRVVSAVRKQQVKPQAGVDGPLHSVQQQQQRKVTRVSRSNHRSHQVLMAARAAAECPAAATTPTARCRHETCQRTAGWAGLMELHHHHHHHHHHTWGNNTTPDLNTTSSS